MSPKLNPNCYGFASRCRKLYFCFVGCSKPKKVGNHWYKVSWLSRKAVSTVRHSHQSALWLVEAVVRSGPTRLMSWRAVRVVKRIFALKCVVEQWEWWRRIFAVMHIVAEYNNIIMIFYCGLMVHITDTRAQNVVSCTLAHITETVFAHDQHWEEQSSLSSPQLYLIVIRKSTENG